MPGSKDASRAPKQYYEKRIVQALRQLTQYLDKHSRQLLKNQQVTVPQIICLEALSDKGLMTVAVLAGYVHLAPSTIVGIIDRLEAKKFVTRTRDNIDRRTVFVQITETGRNFIASSPHLLHNRLHNNLQQLAESEQIQIANSLDRLVTLMKD